MTLSIGQEFSNYRILGPLGAGAMGEVYRARDTRLDRDVAIKVLPEGWGDDPDHVRRFEREAKALAALNHVNVAKIHALETLESTNLLVLELIGGEDLAARLSRGPLPVSEAVELCRQIADGLASAHDAGVIHRDLKPANVRVTPQQTAKVLDFGLAKPTCAEEPGAAVASLTGEGAMIGTPAYMSPEAVRGLHVDRRTDIWAFGCVLYECLSGYRPFEAMTIPDLVATILEKDPDFTSLPSATPPHVVRLLSRCLDKDPRSRLQDIGEARIALADAAPAPGETHRRSVPGRVGLVVAGLLIGVAAAFFLSRHLSPEGAPPNPLDGATWTRLTDFEGTEFDGCLSPDGRWVTFIADRDGPFDLFAGQVDEGSYFNRTNGSNEVWIQDLRDAGFNADGTRIWLAGGRGRRMKSSPLQGGSFANLLPEEAVNADWTRDGTRVAYHTLAPGDPLYVSAPNDEAGEPILRGAPGVHQHYPTWSFDDQRIFLIRGRVATGDTDLWWVRPDGSDPEQLTRGLKSVEYPAPIDENTVLFVAEEAPGSGRALFSLDLGRRVTRRANLGLEQIRSVSASADGRRLVVTVANPKAKLWTVPIRDDVVTEEHVRPVDRVPSLRALVPRFNGEDLYYLSSRGSGDGLWRLRGETSTEVWPGEEGPLLWAPSVSSDGRTVAMVLSRGTKMTLHVMNSDGSGGLRPLAEEIDVRGSCSFSPDGERIAIAGRDGDGPGLFRINVAREAGPVVRLVRGEVLNPVWSPSRDLIVYTGSQVNAVSALRAVDSGGRSIELGGIELMPTGERARFLPDGTGLVYMQGLNHAQDFHLLDLATLETRRLTRLSRTDSMRSFDITPDGKSIMFDRERPNSDIVLVELPERTPSGRGR